MSREQGSKEIYISTTPHETRLAIVENDQLAEVHYERENEYSLAGSIYNGKVTRVLPGMQSAFVEIGLERDAFLYVTDFLDEQEDSSDFERSSRASRSGQEKTQQPAQPRQQQQHTREAADDHGGEESGTIVIDASAAAADEAPGARKWKSRRGRRRGARGAQGEAETGSDTTVVIGDPEQDGASDADTFSTAMLDDAATDVDPGEGRAEEGDSGRESRRERFRERRAQRSAEREEEAPAADDMPLVDAAVFEAGAPMMLPGESLRKYGAKTPESEARAAASAATAAARPASTEYVISGWDGSDALPGETLSRKRRGGRDAGRGGPRGRVEAAKAELPEVSVAAEPGEAHSEIAEHSEPEAAHEFSEKDQNAAGHEPGEQSVEAAAQQEDAAQEEDIEVAGAEENAAAEATFHEPEETLSESVATETINVATETIDDAGANVESSGDPGEHSQEVSVSQPDGDASTDAELSGADGEPRIDAQAEPLAEQAESSADHELTPSDGEPAGDAGTIEEPESGSASFRVDVHPPSEFRLPFGRKARSGKAPKAEKPAAAADAEPSMEEIAAAARHEIAHNVGHELAAQHVADDQEIFPAVPDFVIEEDEQETAWVDPATAGSAGESAHPHDRQTGPDGGPSGHRAPGEVSGMQAFAPGEGELEEEVVEDEEEFDFDLLRADGDEPDFESLTEETLDGEGEGNAGRKTSEYYGGDDDDEDIAEDEADEDAESEAADEDEDEEEPVAAAEAGADFIIESDPESAGEVDGSRRRRRSERRGVRGRRNGREGGREGGREQGREQPRDTGGERVEYTDDGRRRGGPSRRASAQLSDLPIISELLKPGQEILVQIAKEPIAKKGARITSHIALPGRFLVFMPTVNHVGVSRKISSEEERQKLKRILLSEMGDAPGGFIVRTIASTASEQDLRADIRFLLNLWAEIKQRSEAASSPALIYHDLSLVERVLRDQVTERYSAIWVDTETEYERVVKFLSRFQPGLVRHVKLYTKETPLFEQFGLQDEINKALKSKVWLKSGGSIVINQTEALVAIDINTGKYVGKTARLEDTILKTNLDAIPEIVRQIRLRDLGGIIVIDFIDMDDRRNRNKVMAALEDELKSDRAPSKVLQFNDFGLVVITRKRVKQSLERTLSMPCLTCEGTGMVKNPTTVCNEIYIELRKMYRHLERRDILLRVHPEVVKQLKSNGSKWLQDMEELAGKTIMVKSDPSLLPEQFDIH